MKIYKMKNEEYRPTKRRLKNEDLQNDEEWRSTKRRPIEEELQNED